MIFLNGKNSKMMTNFIC